MPRVGRSPPPESSNRGAGDRNEMDQINELQRSLVKQQKKIDQLQQQQQQQSGSNSNQGVGFLTEGNLIYFSIRDALDAVPVYDGENIPFIYFVEGCEEALSMVTPTQENILVRAIRNKLKGDAHRSILGKIFNNMREMVEFLRAKYGPRETVYEAQGRLAYICQKKDEKVATYANRVRELGKRILDAQRRETGEVSEEFQNSIEAHLKTSFLRGLNKEIIISKDGTFEQLESRAIDTEKELETVNMIRRVVLAENNTIERRATRRIDVVEIICQYCHKKGHTADRCRQIPKQQGNVEHKNSNNSIHYQRNLNRTNQNFSAPLQFQMRPNFPQNPRQAYNRSFQNIQNTSFGQNNQPSIPETQLNPIMCRYCKKLGHSIEECRKRAYNNNNNNQQQIAQNQGNKYIPDRQGATSGMQNTCPSRIISTEPISNSEE